MVQYSAYPQYSTEGFPVNWERKRLRFALRMNPSKTEIGLNASDLVSFVPMDAVGEYGGLRLSEERELGEIGGGYTYFRDDDVVVAKITPCFENGKGALAKGLKNRTAFGTTELHVMRAHQDQILPKFLFYLTISNLFRKMGESEMFGAGGQKRVPESFFKDFRAGLPSRDEQQSIARFLDFKTAQIDALIAKKKSLLEKLDEKRTALISHAVTKGIAPSVPMKDSGVVWVGRIPSHWTIRRLKEVGSLMGGAGFPHDLQNVQDEELYFYKVGDLSLSENGKTLLSSPHTISRETAKALRASVIPNESIVYAKIGAALLLNRRRMTTSDCCIDNNMTAYVVNRDRVSPDWAFYWLTTIDFAEHVNPGAVPSFSEGYQSVLSIPLPPIDEQQSIVSFLEEHTTKIDVQVKKIEAVIERLLEYRSAIITNAVTGKIDVRDVSIGQPQEA
jgi:type I restriction enzyme S subunit